MSMRLFIRSTGCPVPSAVEADSQQTIEELWGQLRQSGKLGDACDERLRLVRGGNCREFHGQAAPATPPLLPAASLLFIAWSFKCLQVHRGRVLRQRSAQLGEVCSDGDVLVLLPGRPAVLPCLPSGPPCKVSFPGRLAAKAMSSPSDRQSKERKTCEGDELGAVSVFPSCVP